MNIALCFCVRNCGKYLPDIFENIELLKTLDFNIFCIFIYDNCSDNSEKLLIEYQKKNEDSVIIENIENTSNFRTERIAKARNTCLDIVYNKLENISYHIMIDSDNIGSPKWNIDIINKYLNNFDNDDWDCISFNKNVYYDIWALSYDDLKHHCWGYLNNKNEIIDNVTHCMRKDIVKKLENAKSNSIEVLSAFNGFGIYKTDRFKGFYYDGLYENFKKIITDDERTKTLEIIKQKFNLDIHINNYHTEICEHLFYHLSAVKKGRKIKISKFIINNYIN